MDFGLDQLSSIQGTVFNDVDQDGEQDPGEATLPGWAVTLVGPAGSTTILTDSAGRYAFRDLKDGTYTASLALQGHSYLTQPASGTYTETVSGPYDVHADRNFDVLMYSTIAGTLAGQTPDGGSFALGPIPLQGWDVHLIPGTVAIDAGGGDSGIYRADAGYSAGQTAVVTAAINVAGILDPAPRRSTRPTDTRRRSPTSSPA